MNTLINYFTSRVSKGVELQQRGDVYKKSLQEVNRLW